MKNGVNQKTHNWHFFIQSHFKRFELRFKKFNSMLSLICFLQHFPLAHTSSGGNILIDLKFKEIDFYSPLKSCLNSGLVSVIIAVQPPIILDLSLCAWAQKSTTVVTPLQGRSFPVPIRQPQLPNSAMLLQQSGARTYNIKQESVNNKI